MPELTTQFEDALSNIEPTTADKDNAPMAHAEVSDALAADPKIAGWGFKPILIGSYKRHVSIRRIKDVDVFGRLTAVDDDVLPKELLGEFERVLRKAFTTVDGNVGRLLRAAGAVAGLVAGLEGCGALTVRAQGCRTSGARAELA